MNIARELRRQGWPRDVIATAKVDGKPISAIGKMPNKFEDMNKTESAYAIELDCQKREGKIVGYWFESVKLKLANRTHYTPDFLVLYPDGRLQFVEIKGFLRDDAAVKFKMAREKFSWANWIMLRRVNRKWELMNI